MTTNIQTAMATKEWLMLVVLSIFWGGSFFFVEIALQDFSALTIVALRVSIATILLWTIVLYTKLHVPISLKLWLSFLIMGILNNAIPFSLITWGQTQIDAGLASIFNSAVPFFAVIMAGLFLPDEKVSSRKVIGVVIGFIGVSVMIGFPEKIETGKTLAQLAILLAGISYSFAGTFGRRFKKMGVNPIVIAAGQTAASSLVMIPIALGMDGIPDVSAASFESIFSVFALAVISTALAYVLYFKILGSAGAINLSLVSFLVPISAILLGVLVLNESLEGIHFVGISLIGFGLITIDGRMWTLIKAKFA